MNVLLPLQGLKEALGLAKITDRNCVTYAWELYIQCMSCSNVCCFNTTNYYINSSALLGKKLTTRFKITYKELTIIVGNLLIKNPCGFWNVPSHSFVNIYIIDYWYWRNLMNLTGKFKSFFFHQSWNDFDWEHDQAVVKSEIKKGTKLGKLIIDHFLAKKWSIINFPNFVPFLISFLSFIISFLS